MRELSLGLVVLTLSIAAPAQAGEIDGTDADSPARLAFTEKDLPRDEKDPAGLSEIDEVARRLGFNYARVAQRAAQGDARALKQFFAMAKDVDGAAAESYTGMPTTVYHLLGDEKFAQFLNAQPLAFRMMVRNSIVGDGLPAPAKVYLPRYFPETAKALFRREIVAWPSPDKRFAIRKAFSDEFDLLKSKVERAEVIEQKTGQVLCDLTGDDIGTGWEREGEVLWSPDSKRFAYRSSDLTQHEGNLFWHPDGTPMSSQQFMEQLFGKLPEFFKNEDELRALWSDPTTRAKLLEGLAEKGFGREQLAEMQKSIDAEKSDLFDVLAYVAYLLPTQSREERAARAKLAISAAFNTKQQVFLDFVLSQYVKVGVDELAAEKLTPLLRLKYNNAISDAVADLGRPGEINSVFSGFQKYLYRRAA